MKKSFQKVIIIVLLAGLSLAVSACLKKPRANTNQPVSQNNNININANASTTTAATTTEELEEIDTSDWKTYRNEEYGFEFKYPNRLSMKDWAYKTPNWELLIYIGQNQDIGDGAISIGVEKDMKVFDAENIFWPIPRENIIIEETILGRGNYRAKEVVVNFYAVDSSINTLNYFVENSGNLFIIVYNREMATELEENIFKKILSSFIFIR